MFDFTAKPFNKNDFIRTEIWLKLFGESFADEYIQDEREEALQGRGMAEEQIWESLDFI